MKLLRALSAFALAAMLAGCSESTSPQGISPQDVALQHLVGTWVAQTLVYTAISDATQSVDLVSDGGSVTQVITAGGGFTGTTVLPLGAGTYVYTGRVTVANGILTQDFDDSGISPIEWTITAFGDNSMTMECADGRWGFPNDGIDQEVDASIRFVARRQ